MYDDKTYETPVTTINLREPTLSHIITITIRPHVGARGRMLMWYFTL